VINKQEIQAKKQDSTQNESKEIAKWTVMVYFAADNDLDEEVVANLKMMKKVGSSNEVNIIAQLDSRGRGSTFRFQLQDEQSSLDEDLVGEPLPEVNTGDPRELSDFIKWGIKEYPAQHTMLVLWGHGRGWENQDNADRAAPLTTDIIQHKDYKGDELEGWSVARTRNNEVRRFLRAGGSEKPENMVQPRGTHQYSGRYAGRNLTAGNFKDLEQESVAAFLLDQTAKEAFDSSQDVLRLEELSGALQEALGAKTKSKIDVLGMDACLMGMAEVGYQIKDFVHFLVATEDTIPEDGWPYDRILARLVESPEMSPEDFSSTIVREYLLHYRNLEKEVTKSAVNLLQSRSLVNALKELAAEMTKKLSVDNIRVAVLGARATAQNFYLKDYVDLYDFCSKLEKLCLDDGLKSGCMRVMDVIRRRDPDESVNATRGNVADGNFVSDYGFIGHRLRGSNGISIYFPIVEPSTKYAELPFAKDTEWYAFLHKLARLFPEIEHYEEDESGAEGGVKGDGGYDGIKACAGTPENFGQGMVQLIPIIRRREDFSAKARETKPKTPKAKGNGRSKDVKK
jgi:Clostripain family